MIEGFLTAIIGYIFIAGGLFAGSKYVQNKKAKDAEKTSV